LTTKGSILLVEDDADDVFFITRALRNSGVDVHLDVVNDGQAAVEFLSQPGQGRSEGASGSRIVILDLNLPRKSGLEVLRWIRRESLCKTAVVIVLTSSTSEADMNEAYLLGVNSYVIKPTDAMKLSGFAQLLKGYWFGWNQTPPNMAA
jgi:DNA-binding response OmpR family regulator